MGERLGGVWRYGRVHLMRGCDIWWLDVSTYNWFRLLNKPRNFLVMFFWVDVLQDRGRFKAVVSAAEVNLLWLKEV